MGNHSYEYPQFKRLHYKFILHSYFYRLGGLTMTIKIEDGIDDLTAISLVKQVVEQGKIIDILPPLKRVGFLDASV